MKKITLALVALIAIQSQANTARVEQVAVKEIAHEGNFMPPLPPGTKPGFTSIVVQVPSGGCTKEESFRVELKETAKVNYLTILRVVEDPCDAYFPQGTEVELTTAALNRSKPTLLRNPLFIFDKTVH